MGRKDKQSPQRGKKRGPDNISTNDPRESNPRQAATQNKIQVISKEQNHSTIIQELPRFKTKKP